MLAEDVHRQMRGVIYQHVEQALSEPTLTEGRTRVPLCTSFSRMISRPSDAAIFEKMVTTSDAISCVEILLNGDLIRLIILFW